MAATRKSKVGTFVRAVFSILKLSPSQEIVRKSLDRAAGLDFEWQNPDKLLKDLRKDLTHYDAMMLDDRISSGINLWKLMSLSIPYGVQPASQEKADIEIANEIEMQLGIKSGYSHDFKYKFSNVLDHALDARVYGFKIAEKVFRIHESKMRLMNIKFRHSIFFDFDYDEFGNLDKLAIGMNYGGNGFEARSDDDTSIIEGIDNIRGKFIIFTWPYSKDGIMYGQSDLIQVYQHYRSKLHIQKQRNIFLEKWGSPILEVLFNAEAIDETEKAEMDELIEHWQEGTVIRNPGQLNPDGELVGKFKILLHEVKTGSGTQQFENAIDQLDKQILRALLFPDKLGFSESPGGSYNQSETQFDILKSLIKHTHTFLADEINDLVKQIVDYNFEGVTAYPTFSFQPIDETIAAQLLQVLLDKGVIDKREKWIRKYIRIPELSIEEREEIEAAKEKEAPQLPGDFPAVGTGNDKPKAQTGDEDKRVEDENDEKKDVTKKMKRGGEYPFDAEKIKSWYESQEEEFSKNYIAIMYDMQEEIIDYINRKKIVEDKNTKLINQYQPSQSALKKLLIDSMYKWFFQGKINAKKELKGRVKEESRMKAADTENWTNRTWVEDWLDTYGLTLTKADRKQIELIKQRSYMTTGLETDREMKKTRTIIDNGIRSGKPAISIIAEIRNVLTEDRKQYALTIARTNMSTEYNNGRMNFFNDPDMSGFIVAYRYDAIMDDATTDFCSEHNGQIIMANDPELANILPPNHFNNLAKGTLVKTRDGDFPIETIKPGQEVLTHRGRFCKVYDTMSRYETNDMLEITLKSGEKIIISPDHPIMNMRGDWVDAGTLEVGKYIRIGIDLTNKCTNCGNEFIKKHSEQKTCSYKCAHVLKKVHRYCKTCGIEIPLIGKKKNNHYCSQKCMGKGMIKNHVVCATCGSEVIGSLHKSVAANRKFCNRACYMKFKGRTSIEEKVANVLKSMNINFEEQFKLGKYNCDFYLPEHKIVIEADGNYWHSSEKTKNRDKIRDEFMTNLGFTVLRFGQDMILDYKFENELKGYLNAKT